ncbi:MAG: hypothetical protein WCX65_19840 [bacterium]
MWDKQKLSGRTFTLTVCGDDFAVRKIKVADLFDDKEEDPKKKACNLISKALINPALTPDEVNGLDYDIYTELQEKIMELNGLSEKGKEAIRGNLTEIPPVNSSSKSPDGSKNTVEK